MNQNGTVGAVSAGLLTIDEERARSPFTSGADLSVLLLSRVAVVHYAALGNPNLPVETMEAFLVQAPLGQDYVFVIRSDASWFRALEVFAGNSAVTSAMINRILTSPLFRSGYWPSGGNSADLQDPVFVAAVKNANCPPKLLAGSMDSDHQLQREAGAGNPRITEAQAHTALLLDPSDHEKKLNGSPLTQHHTMSEMIGNPAMSDDFLFGLVPKLNPMSVMVLAAHLGQGPRAESCALKVLEMGDPECLVAAARIVNDPNWLRALAGDPLPHVRESVALNSNTGGDLIAMLCRDEVPEVRYVAAQHAAVTEQDKVLVALLPGPKGLGGQPW